jgi:dephospho-CoA kinase
MIIGITGKIGCGKSTLAEYLTESYGYTEYTFATPLKQIGEIFGFSVTELYGNQEQKLETNKIWGVSAREFLQKVGTELFRESLPKLLPDLKIKRGIWSDIFRNLYEKKPELYVVSDIRFLDEYQTIKDLGGIVIRITRNETINKGGKEHVHRSEMELDYIIPDFTIENNGDLEELKGEMDKILKDNILN